MLCPSCGAEVGDAIRTCENCTPKEPSPEEQILSEADQPQAREVPAEGAYAGFWIRFAALIIDGTILGLPLGLLNLLLTKFAVEPLLGRTFSSLQSGGSAHHGANMGYLIFGSLIASLLSVALIFILLAVCGWFYFVWFESSPAGATPGKKFCGLRVLDVNGEGISFWQASKRYFSHTASLPLFIGYFFNVFTEKKQTLHDLIARTVVVRTHYPSTPLIVGTTVALMLLGFGAEQFVFDSDETQVGNMFSSIDTQLKSPQKSQPAPPLFVSPPPRQEPEYSKRIEPELIPPTPVVEKDIWEFFPPSPEGPHAFIGLNGKVVKAQLVLGVAYPAGNSISLGFFQDKLAPEEIAEFQRRGTLTSAVNLKRAMLVLSIEFGDLSSQLSANDIKSYTATFYADGSDAPFHGSFKAASLSRKRENFAPDEVASVTGNGAKGGRVAFNFQASGSAPAGGSNKVRWDLRGDASLFAK